MWVLWLVNIIVSWHIPLQIAVVWRYMCALKTVKWHLSAKLIFVGKQIWNMATFSWFNFYLNEVGHDFNLDLPSTLVHCRRGILVRFAFDFLLNHLIFGPLNIAVWRGVWGYAYYYFTLVISVTRCHATWAKKPQLQDCLIVNLICLFSGLFVSFTLQGVCKIGLNLSLHEIW